MNAIPVSLLVRTSTARQDTTRQVEELKAVADSKGWEVVEICEEQVSGAKDACERSGLNRIRELVEAGRVRKVLVHEVSRVARRNSVAHEFLEFLEEHKVSLYWHSQGIETLLDNGKRNPSAAVMFALLSEMARAERDLLVERIKSGLALARFQGKTLGRPRGSTMDKKTFLHKHRDVVRRLKEGHSVRNTAKICGVSCSTVQRVKGLMNGKEE